MTIGMYYQGELEHQYQNLHVTSMHGNSFATTSADGTANALSLDSGNSNAAINAAIKCNGDGTLELSSVCRQDLKVQQPWNIGLCSMVVALLSLDDIH